MRFFTESGGGVLRMAVTIRGSITSVHAVGDLKDGLCQLTPGCPGTASSAEFYGGQSGAKLPRIGLAAPALP
jgi:hypothetical protein